MGKRSFYEDDELIINKPGVNVEISPELKQQQLPSGGEDVKFVDGMTIRTTPIFEEYANKVRHYLHHKFSLFDAELSNLKSAFHNEVTCLKSEIHTVVQDPVLPGLIYILTGALTGSILVRNRALPIRFIVPTAIGTGALSYYMPKTYQAIGVKYERLEQDKLPEVAKQRQELIVQYQKLKQDLDENSVKARDSLESGIHDIRKFIKDNLP
ncbi:uncharacterized protein SPAPADRAFT_61501 [Spathaspora passalidarum NRRL Y-27907]|uniref:MICOS complex subunit n=1 Tax=Spathaspora passalidarum (strain NRRL Y-27907 / 11-Y1) TaxID=619300 RepID=G3AN15_SPAPN|nr:uncharacterized protein SPAPADRAFT_61501 [Spathaspora passalidarum NRRL Y-27907]EGW32429.1 hypothetical protein SPAPADRAFT_61501 [Spathaspora passalidarum NRRL Y-27907]